MKLFFAGGNRGVREGRGARCVPPAAEAGTVDCGGGDEGRPEGRR